jgi:hypothetical protein
MFYFLQEDWIGFILYNIKFCNYGFRFAKGAVSPSFYNDSISVRKITWADHIRTALSFFLPFSFPAVGAAFRGLYSRGWVVFYITSSVITIEKPDLYQHKVRLQG